MKFIDFYKLIGSLSFRHDFKFTGKTIFTKENVCQKTVKGILFLC